MKRAFVYMMSNANRTTLYIGVTNDMERRAFEHKAGNGSTFTKRYNLFHLVYFEPVVGMQQAIDREKQLKNWRREWKWNLIKEQNPELKDLAADWFTKDEIEEARSESGDSETSSE